MKLTVDGKTYDLRFNSYDQVYRGRIKPLKDKEVPTTQVYIAWVEGSEVRTAMATSFCSPKDEFDEKKGRKVALGRALGHIWPAYTDEQIRLKPELKSADQINKAKRELFWKEFLTYREPATYREPVSV
jgi:hypothetical protein